MRLTRSHNQSFLNKLLQPLPFIEDANRESLESILPTFYGCICTNILAQIKSLTFISSTKKLSAKLPYKKAAHKMLVKLAPGGNPITKEFCLKKTILVFKL
jgi:hypothetical protein